MNFKARDLAQDENKISLVKPKEIHKITIIFNQNGKKLSTIT